GRVGRGVRRTSGTALAAAERIRVPSPAASTIAPRDLCSLTAGRAITFPGCLHGLPRAPVLRKNTTQHAGGACRGRGGGGGGDGGGLRRPEEEGSRAFAVHG